MNLKIYTTIIFSAFVLVLSSCSDYQKVFKSSDYNLKYTKAVEYYETEEYYKAQTLLEDLVSIFRGTDKAEDVAFYFADCHYKQNDYILGAYYFENFANTYPYSDRAEYAAYTSAYCYYLNSPRESLDQSDTYKAVTAMQVFINKYPESDRIEDANKIIESLRGKLEIKSFNNAKMYYNLSDYQAAAIALKNSLKDFPDSKNREEIMYLVVKSNYLLAENSVRTKQAERFQTTISEYYVFIDEYPESEYLKEIEKMYNKSVNLIKQL